MTEEKKPCPAVEVKSLNKKFGSKWAVQNLTFNITQGSITGFIGPNGAGKTTTLRIMATLLTAGEGSVSIFGQDVRKNSKQIRHQIGFMPDYFGVYDDMEVTEYLDFFAAAYHIPSSQRKQLVGDILALLDLTAKENALVNELSRGMQQRLSLGRALVHDPKLLLLDEPASGLDPRARIELMALLRELRSMGKTIFISSHILAELKDLCDEVVIIERGKMIYNGTVADAAKVVSGDRNRVRFELEEKAAQAAAALENIEGVLETSSEGENTVFIYYDGQQVETPSIIKYLVNEGYEIREVLKETANLEDVFMSLTEGGVA